MDNTVTSRLGKGADYLASLIGIATAGLFLVLAGLADGLLWALLLVAVSLTAAYAVRAERLLLVWPIAIIFGAFAVVMVMPIFILVRPILYVLAAVLLTVDDFIGRPHTA